MSNARSARATGAVFLLASAGLGFILLSLLWNQLFRSSAIHTITTATIFNLVPRHVSAFPRNCTGETIYYEYGVAGIRYEGSYFRRTHGIHSEVIGQSIQVIYPKNDPSKSSFYVPSTMNYYVIAFMVVVMLLFGCISITMHISGRDLLQEWTQGYLGLDESVGYHDKVER
jgi:hypothetical protein